MKVLFRVEFGSRVGWGHASRCLQIARALKELDVEILFCSLAPSREFPSLDLEIDDDDFTHHQLPPCSQSDHLAEGKLPYICVPCDGRETLSIVVREKVDLVVLDVYGLNSSWTDMMRGEAAICRISDYPVDGDVDYLIDYGFDATTDKHVGALSPRAQALLGPAFAPISKDYQRFELPEQSERNEPPRLLVSLGGSKQSSRLRKVIDDVRVVHPSSPITIAGNRKSLGFSLDGLLSDVAVVQADGLAGLFAEHDISIVSGGVSMYEQLAAAKPGIVIETAKNQRLALEKALSSGIVDGVIWPTNGKVRDLLVEEQTGTRNTKEEWLKSRSVVDHLGTLRIALALLNFDLKDLQLREVSPTDLPFLFRVSNQPSSRTSSLNTRLISAEEHLEWSNGLFDGRVRGWIATLRDVPLGQCRIQSDEGKPFVSYSVQQEFQGQGIAARMLQLLLSRVNLSEPLFAKVKNSNYPSLKLLERLGFHEHACSAGTFTLKRLD